MRRHIASTSVIPLLVMVFRLAFQMALPPPPAYRVEPVMKLARGETRKTTAWAISSGSAVRPNGKARPSSSLTSPHSASTRSVLVGPGATLLTRTPRAPNAAAQVRVRDSTASVVHQYVDVSSLRDKRFHRLDIRKISLDDSHGPVDSRSRALATLRVS